MVHENGPPEKSRSPLDVRTVAALVGSIASVSRLILEVARLLR